MTIALPSLSTIPSGDSFARALARGILDHYKDAPEALSQALILLPTRRSCRILQDTFTKLSAWQTLILPKLQTIGDLDEEELSLSLWAHRPDEALLALPPVITALRRQLCLANLILKVPGFSQSHDHALVLAQALGRFIDQVYTENLSMDALANIVPEEFAEHWQITLKFLEIISQAWPAYLAEENLIDAADRRNRLINMLSQHWQAAPPAHPVIAAGTTGSIPAVAQLLKTVSRLQQGHVVLPGMDTGLDPQSWAEMDETHPQFGFKHLCQVFECLPQDVALWPASQENQTTAARRILARELMRPASMTASWADIKRSPDHIKAITPATKHLSLYECTHEGEEAEVIASLMREALETPDKTIAVITPDRGLADRIKIALSRWDLTIDDTAGTPLRETPITVLFRLALETLNHQVSPHSLLALLRHPYCRLLSSEEISLLERTLLRGPAPRPGLEGLHYRLERSLSAPDILPRQKDDLEACKPLLERLDTVLQNAQHWSRTQETLPNHFKTHIQLIETLAGGAETLWQGDAAHQLSSLLSNLLQETGNLPPLSFSAYHHCFEHFLKGEMLRTPYGAHPRLKLMGQLEARLIDADLVILGGLNEGTWPSGIDHDPWLSPGMKRSFGLPVPERSLGLSAHDFVQGFCHPHVVLTRSLKTGGAPSLPARWLQRLDVVLQNCGLSLAHLKANTAHHWVRALDAADTFKPCPRPAPCPPLEQRPRKISATRVEKWLRDPYELYAHYVLRLRALDPLEDSISAAHKGSFLHDILHRFIDRYPRTLPANAADELVTLAQELFDSSEFTAQDWEFWWPRFKALAPDFITHEQNWRKTHQTLARETKGSASFKGITFEARIDRADLSPAGLVLIDYKSGGQYTASKIEKLALPQLPIEALIAALGGFSIAPDKPPVHLAYWIYRTGSQAKLETIETENVSEMLETLKERLDALITAFENENTPYLSLPRAQYQPQYSDFRHLARIKEWSVLSESEGEAA